MSRTASVRQAVAPSCSLLPLERPALSIVTMCSFSREFFNAIDPLQSFNRLRSGHSRQGPQLHLEGSANLLTEAADSAVFSRRSYVGGKRLSEKLRPPGRDLRATGLRCQDSLHRAGRMRPSLQPSCSI